MSFIWFFLWLAFACGVLGFLGWSLNTALTQKKAWRAFAAKYKLDTYKGPSWSSPISIRGTIGNRRLNIYVQTERGERERTQRVYTHIEVFLNNIPPVAFVFSKKPLPEIFGDLFFPQRFVSKSADWFDPAVAMTDDPYPLTNWMTSRRMKTMRDFLNASGKTTQTIAMGSDVQAFLLWRTEDALNDPKILNALVQKLFALAKELDAGDNPTNANPKPSSDTLPPVTPA